jgi:anthranilate synthase component 1
MTKYGGISPELAEFKVLASSHRVIPVTMTVLVDHFTAVGLFHTLCGERSGTFLFESAEAGVRWSRYSFIGVHSSAMLLQKNGSAEWVGRTPDGVPQAGTGMDILRTTLALLETATLRSDLPPLTGGMVGYLSYDVVRQWENIGESTKVEVDIPELGFLLATDMAVLDHLNGTVTLIANAINYDNSPERVDEAYADAVDRLNAMFNSLGKSETPRASIMSAAPEVVVRADPQFIAKVDRVKEYILAGDAFQVVLSQRFSTPCEASGLDVYRVLRSTNPSPYMYLLRIPDSNDFEKTAFEIVGSSPEALVTVQNRHCTVNPIAGTRWRSPIPEVDHALAEEMLSDVKERAEHLMLVDLGRNDLGRVCEPGSVRVLDFMHVERYSHVMHLVSTVTGTLDPSLTSLDALRATFPAGTLSGAPKPRAMQIIEELEDTRRGLYGGCVGYFDFAGNMDMAIAIRTALIHNRTAHVQAGAGIVADSIPQSENDECVNKAMAVLRAVGLANLIFQEK